MLTRILVLSQTFLITASVLAGAQSIGGAAGPAELPPASFGGAQYVDSEGCVFLRAGVNGNTVWVPRVTRSRNLVCGHTPTFSNASADGSAQIQDAAPSGEIINTPQPVATIATPVVPVSVVSVSAPVQAMVQPILSNPTGLPNGFHSAWDDGRLNPIRGVGTAAGDAQMAMVWTNTVPRRLVPKP